jgi:hypothetical protein
MLFQLTWSCSAPLPCMTQAWPGPQGDRLLPAGPLLEQLRPVTGAGQHTCWGGWTPARAVPGD